MPSSTSSLGRNLRNTNRFSLSLNAREREQRDITSNREVRHSGIEQSYEAIAAREKDETGETLLICSATLVDIRPPDTIIILSDDENDIRISSRRSISEYFTPSKQQIGLPRTTSPWTTARKSAKTPARTVSNTVKKTTAAKVRRKICTTANKIATEKYLDDSQKRITSFFNKEKKSIGYCSVLEDLTMPEIVNNGFNVKRVPNVVAVKTDRFSQNPMESCQLQVGTRMCPNKVVEHFKHTCHDTSREDWNMELVQVPIKMVALSNEDTMSSLHDVHEVPHNSKKKIGCQSASSSKILWASNSKMNAKKKKSPRDVNNSGKMRRSKIVCPSYKLVAGTNFAVDAFRYGNIEGVTHYFLSHFHADHYIGLKKSFSKPLIMSPITARLVKTFINVPEVHYQLIELHQGVIIDGVEIIALDANHCPGGIMFLFCLPDGTNVLHTGDFRASPEMEEYPEFWNMSIDSIYLDTTYLSSKYEFKSQWESVADVRATVDTYLKKHFGTNVLIVCGSYLIGKEKVWLELAVSFRMKVWTEPNRWKALKAIADKNQLSVLVAHPTEANIHVLAMKKITYDELNVYMDQFTDWYDSVIAIRPSGWEKNSKPQYRGRINIVGIEYSEHSSFDELKRFVQFLRPREVISTVPYGNTNQNRAPSVPLAWYQEEIRPHRKAMQLLITSFIEKPAENDSSRIMKLSLISETSNKTESKKEKQLKVKEETLAGDEGHTCRIDLEGEDDEENFQRSENANIAIGCHRI